MAIGLLTVLALAPQPVAATNANVSIIDFAFTPATVTVHILPDLDPRVTFTNNGNFPHQPRSDPHGPGEGMCLNGPVIFPGQTVTVHIPLGCVGPIPYHCHIHPAMRGTVNVVP